MQQIKFGVIAVDALIAPDTNCGGGSNNSAVRPFWPSSVCLTDIRKNCAMQNPVPNAYTLAIGGRKPFVVVHTALLELLEPLEVQVGAHP